MQVQAFLKSIIFNKLTNLFILEITQTKFLYKIKFKYKHLVDIRAIPKATFDILFLTIKKAKVIHLTTHCSLIIDVKTVFKLLRSFSFRLGNSILYTEGLLIIKKEP